MKTIVVDDERIVLLSEAAAVKRALPQAEVCTFQKVGDALDYATENRVDIAFLDIHMQGITGLQLAEALTATNPKINLIFCTGYSEYALDALDRYCSAYLLKPVTDEKLRSALANLRYPLSEKIDGFRIQCFGNFEAYYKGQPIVFEKRKTKEVLALLVDRQGATLSTKEIVVALFEEDDKDSYVRNLRADLANTLERLGLSDVLVRDGGRIGVNAAKIDCDYYAYLDGDRGLFHGEYMSQYSFAEGTLALLTKYH